MITLALVSVSPLLRIYSWMELKGKHMVNYVPQRNKINELYIHVGSAHFGYVVDCSAAVAAV